MKKLFLSIAVLVALSITAKAQFILGVKGGVNFSKINTDNFKESSQAGYQAGIFMRAGSGLFFQPELYLSSSGGKFEFQNSNNTINEEGHVRFTNLNVPLLIGQRFGTKNLNVRIMAGPIYTAILDKDRSFSQNVQNAYQDFGNYTTSTLGFQAGAGVDIGSITIDGRYEGGLTKINKDYGQRQNLWALTVGFKVL
ncbi:porin family protein [Mucilaginibacter sp. KACC 22063]|uniref:porin family protein n=1 Tax=Mucilaginibacter sp. KACC 22063 TaxID=3025666 RepID=UPI002365C79D|nr:porin family protein [Mucilaginibacter sp. KACC 22063]WDF55302.1 porin family protein [Mucilaginibacter sp. KACC 22063]